MAQVAPSTREQRAAQQLVAWIGVATASYVAFAWMFVKLVPADPELVTAYAQVPSAAYLVPAVAFSTAFLLNALKLAVDWGSVHAQFSLIACYIAVIAALTDYLHLARVPPVIKDSFGQGLHVLRLALWLWTTPAMVWLLGFISNLSKEEVLMYMAADAGMILACMLGLVQPNPLAGVVGILLSCVFFGFTLHGVWKMFHAPLSTPSTGNTHLSLRALRYFTVVTWTAFVVVFLVFKAGYFSPVVEEWTWGMLDIVGKVMFSSGLLQSNFITIEERRRQAMKLVEEGRQKQVLEELTSLVRQKEQFMSSMSHELRTPLNGIIGLSDALLIGCCGELTDMSRKTISTIKGSGLRLLNLINDILDSTSMKHGMLSIRNERVKLDRLVDDVLDLLKPLAKKGVTLVNEIPSSMIPVAGDMARMMQIFHHLIGNACKFTYNGSITVSAMLKVDEVEVAVADTGIGIPREKFRSIFQPFEQVDAASRREHTGTGFGLTLVKQLVEAHGGTVSLKSKVGVGTTIYITFKAWDPSAHSATMEKIMSPQDIEVTKDRVSKMMSILKLRSNTSTAAAGAGAPLTAATAAQARQPLNKPPLPPLPPLPPHAPLASPAAPLRLASAHERLRRSHSSLAPSTPNEPAVLLPLTPPQTASNPSGNPEGGAAPARKPSASAAHRNMAKPAGRRGAGATDADKLLPLLSQADVNATESSSAEEEPTAAAAAAGGEGGALVAPPSPVARRARPKALRSALALAITGSTRQDAGGVASNAVPALAATVSGGGSDDGFNPALLVTVSSGLGGEAVRREALVHSKSIQWVEAETLGSDEATLGAGRVAAGAAQGVAGEGDLALQVDGAAAVAVAAAAGAQRSKALQVHVLSVDDDMVNQMVIEAWLTQQGFKVTKAMDGKEALRVLKALEQLPDIVLLDVLMPGVNGYEVCRTLRELYPAACVPVIMLSAKGKEEDVVQGLAVGANDYVVKPFSRKELLARIQAHLRHKANVTQKQSTESERPSRVTDALVELLCATSKAFTLPLSIKSKVENSTGVSAPLQVFDDLTMLVVGVTNLDALTASRNPSLLELVGGLTSLYICLEDLLLQHNAYLVDCLEDRLVIVMGLSGTNVQEQVCNALDLAEELNKLVVTLMPAANGTSRLLLSSGIHCCTAMAAIVGVKHPVLQVTGALSDKAMQLQGTCPPGCIHVSKRVVEASTRGDEFVPSVAMPSMPEATFLHRSGPWSVHQNSMAQRFERYMAAHPFGPINSAALRLRPVQRALLSLLQADIGWLVEVLSSGERAGRRAQGAPHLGPNLSTMSFTDDQLQAAISASSAGGNGKDPMECLKLVTKLQLDKEELLRELDHKTAEADRLQVVVDNLQLDLYGLEALQSQLNSSTGKVGKLRAQVASLQQQLGRRLPRADLLLGREAGSCCCCCGGQISLSGALSSYASNQEGSINEGSSGMAVAVSGWPQARATPPPPSDARWLGPALVDTGAAAAGERAAGTLLSLATAAAGRVGAGGNAGPSNAGGGVAPAAGDRHGGGPAWASNVNTEAPADLAGQMLPSISEFLVGLGMAALVPVFEREEITPDMLPYIHDATLLQLGVTSVGDLVRLRRAAQAL